MKATARIGTSGWIYEHWKGPFYPENLPQKEWLDYFSKYFNTVEINNSFYQLPKEETFRDWASRVPDDFVFAPKASRYLTHMKKLNEPREPLGLFTSRARLLENHLGPILYQLPPNWNKNAGRLRDFTSMLPKSLLHAFEFRNETWFDDEILKILDDNNCAFCVHDMPGNPSPKSVTGGFVYVRFHGLGDPYAGRYGGNRLRPWARWINERLEEGRDVYAYFNNDVFGHAVKDAQSLRERVKEG